MVKNSRVERYLDWIMKHKVVAGFVVFGLIVIALANFTEAIERIIHFSEYILPSKASVPYQAIDTTDDGVSKETDTYFPRRIDVNDPAVINVRMYDLRKEAGSSIDIGACPAEPCFRVLYEKMDIDSDPPKVFLHVAGEWEGYDVPRFQGVVLSVPVRRGCGFTLLSPNYNLVFEIQDDRVESIRAWAAILKGTHSGSGLHIKEMSCP